MSIPDDFHEISTMDVPEACERWRVGADKVRQWMAETGYRTKGYPVRKEVAKKGEPVCPDNLAEMAKSFTLSELCANLNVGRQRLGVWFAERGIPIEKRKMGFNSPRQALPAKGDQSLAGQAAAFLTRIAPVYRASLKKPGATGYIVWGVHMSAEAMVEKAKAKGFDPDAWRRVA